MYDVATTGWADNVVGRFGGTELPQRDKARAALGCGADVTSCRGHPS